MKNALSLVKIHIISLLRLNSGKNKGKGNSKKKGSFALAIGVIIALAIIGVGYVYSMIFGEMLALTNQMQNLLPLMLGMCALVAFIFSFYSTSSVLYGGKDYDLLASIPIKKKDILLSKFIYIYAVDAVITLLVMLGATAFYAVNVAVLTFLETLKIIILTFTAPLVPIVLSVFVGVLVTVVSAQFRRRNLVQTVLLSLVLIGIFAISLSGMETGAEIALVEKLYFLYPWLINSFSEWIFVLYFVLVNIGALIIAFVFVWATYEKVITLVKSRKTLKNYQMHSQKSGGILKALYKKEIRRFVSIPTYLINGAFGALMTVVISLALLVFGGGLKDLLSQIGDFVVVFLPCVFAFTFMLTPTTASAMSLEGKTLWLSLTSPVPARKLLFSKILVNLTVNSIPALISAVAFGIALKLSALLFVLIIVTAQGMVILSSVLGLLFDLRFAKYDWQNENQVVKQGTPLLFCVLISMASSVLLGFLGFKLVEHALIFIASVTAVIIVCTIVLFVVLIKNANALVYKRVE